VKIFMFAQYSPDWARVRSGIPTASQFGRIMTPAKRQYSAQARAYALELLDQKHRGFSRDAHCSPEMQHGLDTEPEARAWYAFDTGLDVQQVGFCLTDCGRFGCSPDGLVGPDGGLEIKCPQPVTHLQYLDDGIVPAAYLPQIHGSLIVTGRAWWDFLSYCPGYPALTLRVVPDDFTDALRACLDRFAGELAEVRAKLFAEVAA
jgi:hypothetical protein